MSHKEVSRPPFVVIEGNDGVGKSTQVSRLQANLEDNGRVVSRVKFPRYDQPGGYLAQRYLAGDYGSLDQLGPKLASVLFAVDRFDFKAEIEFTAGIGRIVLADRYVASNLAHQGSKIDNPDQRREFFDWVMDFEYHLLKIPRPTLNLILLVDADVSRQLRAERERLLGPDDDIHADDDYQYRTSQVYAELCRLYPEEFVGIDCQEGRRLKSVEEIGRLIYAAVEPQLNADDCGS